MKRRRLKGGGNYFPNTGKSLTFVPSGCAVLDCVLGGGWPLGRVANIVGDKSTGKTLLAIEACANFARDFPNGRIWYRESEAAFDEEYAVQLGLPVDRVDFGKEGIGTLWDTVEDIFEDLSTCIARANKEGVPGLYIIDSLDALSDRAELARKVGEGSFNLAKPKLLSALFRQNIRLIKSSQVMVLVISQVRDKIGFVLGEKHTRAGGKALDFYASQSLWLSHRKTLTRTIGGSKRATAIQAHAKCKKNKIAMPFRECQFVIRFGYGIEDLEASVDWLAEVKMLSRLGIKADGAEKYLERAEKLPPDEYRQRCQEVRALVLQAWEEVEAQFRPTRQKYA